MRRLAGAVALASVLFASSASAQSASEVQSRALFEQGRAFAEAGKWADACPRFQAAHDLHATGGTALQGANCYEKIGKNDRAIELYQYILDHRDEEKNQERIKIAEERIAALRPKNAVTAPVASSAPPIAAPVTTSAPLAPTTTPIEPAPPPPDARSYAAPIAMFAVGGAGLVVGAIFGGLALSKASAANATCPANATTGADGKIHCATSGGSDASSAKTLGWVSTIGFGVGGAAVITGVVLLATGGKSASSVTATADGLKLRF